MKRNISLLMVVILVISLLCGCKTKEPERISGNEWLMIQKENSFVDLEAFCEGMDEVYTLYIIEAISVEDFNAELNLLNQQYKLMLSVYEDLKEKYPLEPESHSYLSLDGTKAIEGMYETIGTTLSSSFDEQGNPLPAQEIAYMYLAQNQILQEHIATFTTTIALLNASNGIYNTDTSSVDEMPIQTTTTQ